MNEFMNPKSMSTPGAAGALMMLLANSLCSAFPEFAFRYVAIALSFAIGAVVFAAATMRIWERGLYWLVNSLIIFAMGVGASNIGANIAEKRVSANQPSVAYELLSLVSGTAFAQSSQTPAKSSPGPRSPGSAAPGTNPSRQPAADPAAAARVQALEAQVKELQAAQAHKPAAQTKFFKRW